jgi:hypothetical protein
MSTAARIAVVLLAAAIFAAVPPTAIAAPHNVPPDPVSCPNAVEAYMRAVGEIHAAQRQASTTKKRTLHLELVQLRRDRDLEPWSC